MDSVSLDSDRTLLSWLVSASLKYLMWPVLVAWISWQHGGLRRAGFFLGSSGLGAYKMKTLEPSWPSLRGEVTEWQFCFILLIEICYLEVVSPECSGVDFACERNFNSLLPEHGLWWFFSIAENYFTVLPSRGGVISLSLDSGWTCDCFEQKCITEKKGIQ